MEKHPKRRMAIQQHLREQFKETTVEGQGSASFAQLSAPHPQRWEKFEANCSSLHWSRRRRALMTKRPQRHRQTMGDEEKYLIKWSQTNETF